MATLKIMTGKNCVWIPGVRQIREMGVFDCSDTDITRASTHSFENVYSKALDVLRKNSYFCEAIPLYEVSTFEDDKNVSYKVILVQLDKDSEYWVFPYNHGFLMEDGKTIDRI